MGASWAILDSFNNRTYKASRSSAPYAGISPSGQTAKIYQHNKLRSEVNPTASNMRKMVSIREKGRDLTQSCDKILHIHIKVQKAT